MLENLTNKMDKIINEKIYLDKKAAIGFDGFVDKIYRPVSSHENNTLNYFNTIDDFGDRIKQAAGLSCDIDIELETIQPGGNTPLFANSLGHLGINTDCIAPIDEYEDLFNNYLSKNCKIHSIGEPALSFVLEFFDGKIMLGDTHTFKEIDYDTLKNRVGDKIYDILNNYELISMVNWSHFDNMSLIWKKLIYYLNKNQDKINKNKQSLFIDLADTNSRSVKDIKEMLKLLNVFRNYYKVVLGLNENEAKDIGNKILSKDIKDLNSVGKYLVGKGFIDDVVIHPVAEAYLINRKNSYKVSVPKVKNPVLTVGGGDNFNAGFSWGILNNLNEKESLILGTVNARLFVENGKSPSINELLQFIKQNQNSININKLK